jgi:hypothetical protein
MYCHKCKLKNISLNKSKNNIDNNIFDLFEYIINNFKNFTEIYNYLLKFKNKPLNYWIKKNDLGLTAFHHFIWYISVKIHKFNYIKQYIYWILLSLFGSHDLIPILDKETSLIILTIGTSNISNHNFIHYLYKNNENIRDTYFIKIIDIIKRIKGDILEIRDENGKTPKDYLKNINNILEKSTILLTNKYKLIESNIIDYINLLDINISKCSVCNKIINFINDINVIIDYALKKNDIYLLNNLIEAFNLRQKLNNLLSNTYFNSNIKERHIKVIDTYKKNIMNNFLKINSIIQSDLLT